MSVSGALPASTFDDLWAAARARHGLSPALASRGLNGFATLEDVYRLLEKDERVLKVFRERGEKLRAFIKPFAHFVGLFLDSGAEGASAAGVPGGKAVFSVFSGLLAATKGVSQVYDALEEILSKLQGFLGRLETYLANPSVITPAMKEILVKILAQLLEVLALCTKRFEKNVRTVRRLIPKRAEEYIKVLVGNTEVQNALNKLDKLTNEEQQRSIAQILVSSDVAVEAIKEVREEQQEATKAFTFLREEQSMIDIIKWLSPPDHEESHRLISKARQSDTGDWFFGPRFSEWQKTDSGVFWIYGKPGSGKSVLFSSIVDRLSSEDESVYFYLTSKQTVRGLTASLIHQLASQSRQCFDILKKFRAGHHTMLGSPSDDKLFDCLSAVLQVSGRVYILIDALDECCRELRREALIPFLNKIVALKLNELRLLATGRPEADLEQCMSSIATESFSLHDAREQASVLARHVKSRLSNTQDYPDWPSDLRSEAQNVLVSKADGMFIWAELQLKRLLDLPPINVKTVLNTLPTSLYDIYARILKELNTVNMSLTLRVFQCIAFSARPLTPHELAELLALDFEAESAVLRPEYRTAAPESQLLKLCSSIIEVVSGDPGDSGKKVVQFVHFSAQEYLLPLRPTDPLSEYKLNAVAAHTTLAILCLTVLTAPTSDPASPLTDYAVHKWMIHVQLVEVQEAVRMLLSKFLHPKFHSFSRWLEKWIARSDYSCTANDPYDEHSTSLWVAVHLGLIFHTHNLLNAPGVDVNVPGAPLAYTAAKTGNIELTRLVLSHGANIDEHWWSRWTALHIATSQGHQNIVSLLLDQGAAIDAREKDEWTPLHMAALNGHLDVVRLLLERGAAVDAREAEERTPLFMAAFHVRVEVARMLLERGAAIDARDKDGWTPLHLGVQNGDLEFARFLLEHGADGDARDKGEWTPLHVGADRGRIEAVRLLLERGATVDARNQSEWTPLHLAALNGHLEVIRLLLEQDAVVDAREEEERTPLFMAAFHVRVEVARMLLERGAAVDARNQDQWTPLHLAAQNGCREVAHLLLERGAAVDARQSYGESPLHTAALNGQLDVLSLLLERGADIEARNRDRDTPLYLAASNGHYNIVQRLLDHGATFDIRTDSGWTMLHVAASEGHVDIVARAIQLGAHTEWPNCVGRTALLCAAGHGSDTAVHALLEFGASITACDSLGFSALDHAAAGGHAAVVRLLLERGADHRLENAPCGSCIQIAERASRVGAVQLVTETQTLMLREGDAQDAAQLLREARSATVSRADVVLRRLRRYRSVGSWGDIWTGLGEGNRARAAGEIS